jgi:hypothetical protein
MSSYQRDHFTLDQITLQSMGVRPIRPVRSGEALSRIVQHGGSKFRQLDYQNTDDINKIDISDDQKIHGQSFLNLNSEMQAYPYRANNLLSKIHLTSDTSKNDAIYFLKTYLCRNPTQAEIDQYLISGSIGGSSVNYQGSPQTLIMVDHSGLNDIHNEHDVIFFDTLCDLVSPSQAYFDYIEHIIKPDPVLKWDPQTQTFISVSSASELSMATLKGFSGSKCTESGNIVYLPKYNSGKYSPYSKAVSVRSSANRLSGQICKLPDLVKTDKGLNLIGIDLTFPQDISLIGLQDPEQLIKIAEKAIKHFIKGLKKEFPWLQRKDQKLGYLHNIHIWHSHHPKTNEEIPIDRFKTPDAPHLHVHFNLLNLIVGGSPESPDFIRFNPKLDRDLIKTIWSYSILKATNQLVLDPVFFLHFIPLTQKAKVKHRIKYCGRSQLNDLFNYYQDNTFNPDIPQKYNEFLVNYKNTRHTSGFLRNLTALVGEIDGDRICSVCIGSSEKVKPLSIDEMLEKRDIENIPIAIYGSRSKKISILSNSIFSIQKDPPEFSDYPDIPSPEYLDYESPDPDYED